MAALPPQVWRTKTEAVGQHGAQASYDRLSNVAASAQDFSRMHCAVRSEQHKIGEGTADIEAEAILCSASGTFLCQITHSIGDRCCEANMRNL